MLSELLKALLSAQATILGFFGIIAVYLITAYDNKMDKIEEQIQTSDDKGNWYRTARLTRKQQKTKKRKQLAIMAIVFSLLGQFVSIILSIIALGLKSIDVSGNTESTSNLVLVFLLNSVTTGLLFMGVASIVFLLLIMRKDPEN